MYFNQIARRFTLDEMLQRRFFSVLKQQCSANAVGLYFFFTRV